MEDDRIENPPKQDQQRERLKTSEKIGIAILVGVAALIAISGMNLYETWQQRAELKDRLTQFATPINTRPAKPGPARPTGPDPGKIYTVKTEGAPFEGPNAAPITIAEFSDFQ